MLALTIWQPWASLIVGSPPHGTHPGAPPQKPVENRTWRPPAKMISQRIAIHAGKTFDRDAWESIFLDKNFGEVASPYSMPGLYPVGAVVGVVTLDRVIALQYERDSWSDPERRFATIPRATIESWGLGEGGLRWFFGPMGWVFRDQCCIDPVPCNGAQGLWALSDDVERAVVAQIARAA